MSVHKQRPVIPAGGGVSRRSVVLMAAASCITGASAQTAFTRPIRILVGFSAGGGTDTIARLYAQSMQQTLGTPVIVENKPGASQLLAIRPTLTAPPDGYTLFLGVGSSLASGPGVRKDLPYDPLKDFGLIAMVATAPGVFFVDPALPIRTMRELVDYAKANPGKLNYGSAGVGASNHLQMEYLMKATGVSLAHIPYKSDQEVVREVAAGSVQVGLTIAQFPIPLVQAGKLRAIAVTGARRLRELPDVPSLAETGISELKGIDSYTFYGLVGPAGLPVEVVNKLSDAVNKASATPELASRLRDTLFFEPATGTPPEFRRFMEAEVGKWRELGKSLKVEVVGG